MKNSLLYSSAGMIFFSYLTDFSYFSMEKKSDITQSEWDKIYVF